MAASGLLLGVGGFAFVVPLTCVLGLVIGAGLLVAGGCTGLLVVGASLLAVRVGLVATGGSLTAVYSGLLDVVAGDFATSSSSDKSTTALDPLAGCSSSVGCVVVVSPSVGACVVVVF